MTESFDLRGAPQAAADGKVVNEARETLVYLNTQNDVVMRQAARLATRR